MELQKYFSREILHNSLLVEQLGLHCELKGLQSINPEITFVLDDPQQILESAFLIRVVLFVSSDQTLVGSESYILFIELQQSVLYFLDVYVNQMWVVRFHVSGVFVFKFPFTIYFEVCCLVKTPVKVLTFISIVVFLHQFLKPIFIFRHILYHH